MRSPVLRGWPSVRTVRANGPGAAPRLADRQEFREAHLWTFKGRDAARSLYERSGFRLVHEVPGTLGDSNMHARQFVRPTARRPSA